MTHSPNRNIGIFSLDEARRQARLIAVAAVGVLLCALVFGSFALSRLQHSETMWLAYNHRINAISGGLARIQQHIGYGGFIHNLKSLAMSRDVNTYAPRIEQNLRALRTELDNLQGVLVLPENRERVDVIRSVFAGYESRYRQALLLIAAGKSVLELDAALRIDDAAALDAFSRMTERAGALTQEAESKARQANAEALRFLAGGGLLFLFALIVATAFLLQRVRDLAAANAEIRQRAEREHDFSQSATDWFWETDAAHCFTYLSDNFETIFAIDRRQLLGQNRYELLVQRGKVDPLTLGEHQMLLDARQPFRDFEYRIRDNLGALRWMAITGVPYRDAEGCFAGYRGTGTDITTRKQDEVRLAHARDRAEQASRAKTAFLSSMSHELRTPMNAILGFAQMLEVEGKMNAAQQDSVAEILKAGHHLMHLLNEVLDLSRIESGRLDMNLDTVALAPLLQECGRLVAPQAQSAGLALRINPLPEVDLQADATRLKQCVVNLLSNAVKYNRPHGEIRLHHEAVGANRVRIIVADTGIGIAPARLHDIFEPFNRIGLENSNIEGAGIGLSITRRLVEMMGGEIGVDSTPDVGSAFWLELAIGPMAKVGAGETASEGGAAVAPPGRP